MVEQRLNKLHHTEKFIPSYRPGEGFSLKSSLTEQHLPVRITQHAAQRFFDRYNARIYRAISACTSEKGVRRNTKKLLDLEDSKAIEEKFLEEWCEAIHSRGKQLPHSLRDKKYDKSVEYFISKHFIFVLKKMAIVTALSTDSTLMKEGN